jgi:hypothetical protein
MSQLGRIVRLALTLAAVAFVAWTAWDLADKWQSSEPVQLDWALAFLATLPMALVALGQAIGWRSLLQHLVGKSLPWLATLDMLLASMLGRYMPAKAGMPAILIARARDIEVPAPALAASLPIMAGVYAILGMAIGLGSLLASAGGIPEGLDWLRGPTMALIAVGTVAALGIGLFVNRTLYPKFIIEKLQLSGDGPLLNLPFILWFVMVWACWWIHGVLVIVAFGGSWADGVAGAGVFVLAPVIGFLALVAPGGIGVREAVIGQGLSALIGSAAAASAGLLARIASLGMDVIVWLVVRAIYGRRQRES